MSERNNWDEVFLSRNDKMLYSTVYGSPIADYAGQIHIRVGKIIELETGKEVEETEELINAFKQKYIEETKEKPQYKNKIF